MQAAQRLILRSPGFHAVPVRRTSGTGQHVLRSSSSPLVPSRSCSTSAPVSVTGVRPSRSTGPSSPTPSRPTCTSTTCRGCRSSPADRPGAQLDVYAPPQEGQTLGDAFHGFIRPPYFPIRGSDPRGTYRFHEVADTDLVIGDAKVMVRSVPHVGLTNGYRVDLGGGDGRLRERPPDARRRPVHALTRSSSWPTATTCRSTTRSTRPRSSPSGRTGVTARWSSPSTSPAPPRPGAWRCSTTTRCTATRWSTDARAGSGRGRRRPRGDRRR